MNKLLKYSLLISLTFLPFASQGQGLIGTKWENEVVANYCIDTIEFKTDSRAIWYSCEMTWHYEGTYTVDGNKIIVEIWDSRGMIDGTSKLEPSTKWILEIRDSSLKYIYIGQNSPRGYEEVNQEVYEQLNELKKVM